MMGKKGDTGVNLSLGAIVGLILAVLAILLLTSIVAGLITAFSADEESQFQNFVHIYNSIDQNERSGDYWKRFPAVGFVKEDYAIIGMSNLEGLETAGETYEFSGKCKNEYVVKHARSWIKVWQDEVELKVVRDMNKCPADTACLCLCKFSGTDVDCRTNAICMPFRSDEGKDIVFKGTTGDSGCDIAIIYQNTDTDLVSYCIRRESDYFFDVGSCDNNDQK